MLELLSGPDQARYFLDIMTTGVSAGFHGPHIGYREGGKGNIIERNAGLITLSNCTC